MKRSARGFTLVELLVVIGIIALLISILLPSLSRARQHAVSAQCLSNLKQIGTAAMMYANENKGILPLGQGGNKGNATLEKFMQWPGANGDSIRESMARFVGVKNATAVQNNTVPVRIFYCPADDQALAGSYTLGAENFLQVSSKGQNDGKFKYWWTAAPWAFDAALNTWGGPDGAATQCYVDMDGDNQTKAGVEYVRKVGDKRAAEIAICVDRSKQKLVSAGNPTGTNYFMHGTNTGSQRGWKNELFGDFHAESKRSDEMQNHWGTAATGFAGW
jgi:prepilin-type N-terminal cleavage/methylation domain-containing protein